MTRTTLAMAISLSLTGCAERAPEQQWQEDVAEALGGRQAIESATTLTLQVEGTLGNLGQDMTPEATAQSFSVKAEGRSDLTAPRTRTDRTRTPQFNYFRGPAPMAQNVVAENVADGIWLLAGESHHSVLVEFSDHLMMRSRATPRT